MSKFLYVTLRSGQVKQLTQPILFWTKTNAEPIRYTMLSEDQLIPKIMNSNVIGISDTLNTCIPMPAVEFLELDDNRLQVKPAGDTPAHREGYTTLGRPVGRPPTSK